jgi:hypothetical protein
MIETGGEEFPGKPVEVFEAKSKVVSIPFGDLTEESLAEMWSVLWPLLGPSPRLGNSLGEPSSVGGENSLLGEDDTPLGGILALSFRTLYSPFTAWYGVRGLNGFEKRGWGLSLDVLGLS